MKIIIVGGGAAGASCAARLRRLDENAEIIILEKTGEISIANCGLPYYCSDIINERDKMLVSKPETFKKLFNIDVKLFSEVSAIDRTKKTVTVNHEDVISYDKLVLTLGANPIKPPIKGINNHNIFTVRTLEDADKIKGFIKENNCKKAVVVGGGFIGVEMAENFAILGLKTSIIELSGQILAPLDKEIAAFAQNQLRDNGVEIILSDGVKEFADKYVMLNSERQVEYDIAIIAIGVKPEVWAAKEAGLKIGENGGILVNEYLQTSDENIFAAGDSVEINDFVSQAKTLIPLAGPANRQGRIIADNIKGLNSTYKNTQGTAIVKVFDITIASSGNNEKQLIKKGIDYKKTFIWGNSHAGYYPNSFPILIKLLFTNNGKILGAQATGYEGVDKRIDLISSIMRLNGTIQDLLDSELCYAPPYSSAKDPINLLGMNADNILKGMLKPAFFDDLEDAYLIDVRPEKLYKLNTIEGAVNIPQEKLRERLNEIPKDKKVVLFCSKGFTSYLSYKVLQQNGYKNIYSLAGGIMLYKEIIKNNKGITISDKQKIRDVEKTQTVKIDACSIQCPGPIMKLSEKINEINDGDMVEIYTIDEGFKSDVKSWCESTGNSLLDITKENKMIKALIQKSTATFQPTQTQVNGQTIIVFSNDLDKALASFIIANGAAVSEKPTVMFFTFWGLNILRKAQYINVRKEFIDKMFSMIMPRGSEQLTLSKMNMGGIGTILMKSVMKKKNILTLKELIEAAQFNGVKLIACNMSMDVMGIRPEELIDGIEIAGVAKYISEANKSNSNLFI